MAADPSRKQALVRPGHLPLAAADNLAHHSEAKNMSRRNAVFPANRHALYERHGYSAAIASGDLLFVSGQVGSRADGSPEPDFAKQVRLAFSNLEATLAAGGCTFDDIVDVTTFHTDPEHQFETIMAEKSRAFREPPY